MNEQLVSITVALRLSEEGFWSDYVSMFLYELEGDFQLDFGKDSPNWDKRECLVPSQSLAQRWLREEKNIHMYIVFRPREEQWIGIIHTLEEPEKYVYTFLHKTYESALEECLEEALKRPEDDPLGRAFDLDDNRKKE